MEDLLMMRVRMRVKMRIRTRIRTMVKICDIESNFVGEVEARTQNFLSADLLPKPGCKGPYIH